VAGPQAASATIPSQVAVYQQKPVLLAGSLQQEYTLMLPMLLHMDACSFVSWRFGDECMCFLTLSLLPACIASGTCVAFVSSTGGTQKHTSFNARK
jgi:hypothetical protein